MKKFLVVGLLVIGVTQAFSQTYRQMELWVGRVPTEVAPDSSQTTCSRQKVLIYTDKQRFGVVSSTDTLALLATKPINSRAILCKDLFTNEDYILDPIIVDTGFIIFITPQNPRIAKYNLIYSTTPCYQTLSSK